MNGAAAVNAGASPGLAPLSLKRRFQEWGRRALARRGIVAVADQAIVSAGSFFTSVLLGRLGADSELGLYFLALTFTTFCRGVQEQLLTGPYTVYAPRRADVPAYTGSLVVHQFALSLLSLAALAGLSAALQAGHGPTAFLKVVPILFFAAPLMLFRDFLRQLSFSRLEIGRALAIDVGATATQVIGLTLCASLSGLDAAAAYGCIAAGSLTGAILWFATRTTEIRFCARQWRSDFASNWQFGRWALASQLIGCGMPYLLPWIVAASSGAEAAGLLGAAGTIVGVGNMFVTGICNYLSPRAARAWVDGGVTELMGVLRKTAVLFLLVVGAGTVVAAIWGDAVLWLVYRKSLAGGGAILLLLSLNMLANSLGMTFGNGLWAMEKPAANFVSDVMALVATTLFAACLVPSFGAWGSAAAMAAGTSVGAAARGITLMRAVRSAASERPLSISNAAPCGN